MNVFDYLFEKTATLAKEFLLNESNPLKYSQLYQKCIRLSNFLNQKYGENNNIALIAPNSDFFIIVYLAIMRSGNICIPLNPEIEQKNLDYIQDIANLKATFITSNLFSRLNLKSPDILTEEVIKQETELTGQRNSGLKTDFDGSRIAEIIFTSGSTGEPKGVMITHKNIIANTNSIIEYLSLSEKDVMLVVLPFYYCYGLSLLHTHLRIGGSIVLNNIFILLGNIINDLKKYKCTGFAGVPSHYQILLRKSESFSKTIFTDLRYVTQAGGKLHTIFIEEFVKNFPQIKFYVMYGQTEATARLSYLPPDLVHSKSGSIGKGIPGVNLKVIDENGSEVKEGEIGEIIARGDNIMAGYYRDPESTKKALKNNWLYTGDLARVDKEGYIFLTARKKEIIKVGGKRISPKEIEEVIVSIPQVVDCTIEAVDDDILGEAIKAVITVKDMNSDLISDEYIRNYCADYLSAYKIPQIIQIKDKISISATGKKIKK